jgi:hypothetical protein
MLKAIRRASSRVINFAAFAGTAHHSVRVAPEVDYKY